MGDLTIKTGTIKRVLGGILLLAIVGGGIFAVTRAATGGDPFGGLVDPERYQAVILTNDRVYFGRLRDADGDFYELRDAFFIRRSEEGEEIVPLSEELHRPDDTMLIRREEVRLVENLQTDSPVATAIEQRG